MRLQVGMDPARLGLTQLEASSLLALDEPQLIRSGKCHVPLFALVNQTDVLSNALAMDDNPKNPVDPDTQLLLLNRWRAAAGPFSFAELYYGMTRAVYDLLKGASFAKIQTASASGLSLSRLAVRHHYFRHAGPRIDLMTSQRNKLAVCNSNRVSN